MNSKKKTRHLKKKSIFFEHQLNSINKIRRQKNNMTAENINSILDRHFLTLELIKFNLFGEDFENYGNIEINGQTYYPYKLNLDYLANQQSDDIKQDFNIDFDILNSLKNADDLTKINLKQSQSKNITTTKYNKMLRNKSMGDISDFNKINTNNQFKLPKIKNHHAKLKLASNYMKYILLKKFPDPKNCLTSKGFISSKTDYLKRHGTAIELNKKLNRLENKVKSIDNEIENDIITNKEKVPQFQFRYRYIESKFKV